MPGRLSGELAPTGRLSEDTVSTALARLGRPPAPLSGVMVSALLRLT